MSDYGTPPPPPPGGGYASAHMPPGGGMAQGGAAFASWPVRVGGYLIDSLLTLPGYILYWIGAPKTFSMSTTVGDTTNATSGSDSGNIPVMLLGIVIMLGIGIWNRWIKGGQGQTVGRKVMGITLLGEETGQPIGTGKAFVRDLAHIVDSLICYIGWLFPLWDSKRQTLADKIMKTVVVSAK
jgi:uncharacterized RDD family membrane protein YckC